MPRVSSLRLIALAITALCILEASHARAGVLLQISETGIAAPPDFYFINGNTLAAVFNYGGNITGSVSAVTTNRPGDPINNNGTLSTTVNLGNWNATAGQVLNVLATPWNDVSGFNSLTGPLHPGDAQLATIQAAGPGPFNIPSGPTWFITSDVNIPGASPTIPLVAQNRSVFQATGAAPVPVNSLFDPANNSGERSVTVPATTGTLPYTLSQLVVITNTGGTQTFQSVSTAARTVVTAVPEPSTFVGATVVAMGGLAFVRLRARRRSQSDA